MTSSDGRDLSSDPSHRSPDQLDLDLILVGDAADRDAFRRIFTAMAPKLKAFLINTGQSPQEAEEILQDTMLKVWRKATLFDRSKSAGSTWIYSIAKNARIDRIRKETKPAPDPDDPSFVQDAPETGEQSLNRRQDQKRIQLAMSTLPSEQMKIINMSFFEDKSHAEISEELNLPLGTVKSRIRLAFGKIRAELERNQ